MSNRPSWIEIAGCLCIALMAIGASLVLALSPAEASYVSRGGFVGEYNAGNSGTALTVNWNDGDQQRITLTGNVTLTLTNSKTGGAYALFFVQDATGGRTVTWPANVKPEEGVTLSVLSTASRGTFCALRTSAILSGIYLASCAGIGE